MPVTSDKLFHTSVISPEAELFDAEVSSVQVPAHDGSIGLLTHRAPVLTKLGTGVLVLNTQEGPRRFVIAGGYAQMKDNELTVLAEEALDERQATPERLEAERRKLAAVTGSDLASLERRQALQARVAALQQFIG